MTKHIDRRKHARLVRKAEKRINQKIYNRIKELEQDPDYLAKLDKEIADYGLDYVREHANEMAAGEI